jgi:hypothetical protein
VANILGIIELMKMQKSQGQVGIEYVAYLEQSAAELDAIIRTIVAKSNHLDDG